MSTNANVGIGAALYRWDTSSSTGVWEKIVEVFNLSYDGPSREVIEVFKLDNSDDYVNKIQGVINANSITASIYFTHDQYIQLKADLENRGNINYQVVLPLGEGLEWEGFITELPLDIGSDDVMQGDVVFEVDGKPDFVSAATSAIS